MLSLRSSSVSIPTATPANDLSTTTLIASGIAPTAPSGYTAQADSPAWAQTVTLNSGNSWTSTVRGLEKADGQGNEYVYYIASVSETGVPSGTTVSVSGAVYGNSGPGTLTITDTLPTTTISAHKDWQGTNPSEHPASVTFHLWADGTEVTPSKTANSDNSWTVSWGNLPYYNASGSAITYTVTEDAVTGYDLTSATYSGGTFTLVNTYVPQTGSLKVIKVEKGTSTKLPGAEFQLTRSVNGTYSVFENDQFTESAETNKKTGPFSVGNTGEITITNLLPGDYKLSETKAPAGYIITTGEIDFTINVDGTVTVTGRTADSNGNITYSDTDNMVTFAQKTASAAASVTVQNEPGVALPATGGPGTVIYTAAGLSLLLGASLWLMLRRRKEQQN